MRPILNLNLFFSYAYCLRSFLRPDPEWNQKPFSCMFADTHNGDILWVWKLWSLMLFYSDISWYFFSVLSCNGISNFSVVGEKEIKVFHFLITSGKGYSGRLKRLCWVIVTQSCPFAVLEGFLSAFKTFFFSDPTPALTNLLTNLFQQRNIDVTSGKDFFID